MSAGAHGQSAYRRRFDWGLDGARALVADARPGDVAVVVDVLSFTTTLTVALEHGAAVHPYPWRAGDAASYAAARGATLASGRREGLAAGGVSLSPASFLGTTVPARVVLPSPNGSTIAFALAAAGVTVVGACLRNARAVAAWLLARDGSRVSVVAAGERWPGGALRPAVEDLWGAGAVLSVLGDDVGDAAGGPSGGPGSSPEAQAAVAAFRAVASRLTLALPASAGGRELVEAGFGRDVEIAAELDASTVVPVLEGDVFVDVTD